MIEPNCWKNIFQSTGSRPKENEPVGRTGHVIIVDLTKILVLGGMNLQSEFLSLKNIHSFDFVLGKWSKLTIGGSAPKNRSGHRCVRLPGQPNLYFLFGGYSIEEYCNSAYILDLDEQKWHDVKNNNLEKAINGRSDFSLSVVKNVVYLFGGRDGYNIYDELWSIELLGGFPDAVVPKTSLNSTIGNKPGKRFGHGCWASQNSL